MVRKQAMLAVLAGAALAVGAAVHDVLAGLCPAQAGVADSRLTPELSGIPSGPAKIRGIAVGRATAAELFRPPPPPPVTSVPGDRSACLR